MTLYKNSKNTIRNQPQHSNFDKLNHIRIVCSEVLNKKVITAWQINSSLSDSMNLKPINVVAHSKSKPSTNSNRFFNLLMDISQDLGEQPERQI